MRTSQALIVCGALLGCDKGAAPPAPAPEPIVVRPAIAPAPPAPNPPPEVIDPPATTVVPEPVRIRRWHGIPLPPSVVPKKYLPWLDTLTDDDKQKVDTFCKKHMLDFQIICGGIGPLHIPYPPYARAKRWEPGDLKSLYATLESWEDSLSDAQKAYIARECRGGEDQPSSDLCGDNTPLVIAFGNERITFVAAGIYDSPTPVTPWLALDRDSNGTIDSAAELFGSSTLLSDGSHASNGFIALAELDANHDGVIDVKDPAFGHLQLWADRDHDRHGSADELSAAAASIVSISLANQVEQHCDARDNCEGERASIVWRDARGLHDGSVVDVYLPRRSL